MSETATVAAPATAGPAHAEGTLRRAGPKAALLLGPCALLIVLRDAASGLGGHPARVLAGAVHRMDQHGRRVPAQDPARRRLFTFRDGTRAVAGWIEWPLDLLEGVLISGFANGTVPSLPWTMIVGLAAVWGWYLRGWRLSLLAGGCVLYLALFGKWKLSMITLSAVLVAAPIAAPSGSGSASSR